MQRKWSVMFCLFFSEHKGTPGDEVVGISEFYSHLLIYVKTSLSRPQSNSLRGSDQLLDVFHHFLTK